MKLALLFAALAASAITFAQQVPKAAEPIPVPPAPLKAPVITGQVPQAAEPTPSKAPIPAPQLSNTDLSALLRAQTAAIRELSSRIDSLEDRVRKLERGQR